MYAGVIAVFLNNRMLLMQRHSAGVNYSKKLASFKQAGFIKKRY